MRDALSAAESRDNALLSRDLVTLAADLKLPPLR